MVGTTSTSCNTPRDMKIDGDPMACHAFNELEKTPVLSASQDQDQSHVLNTEYEDSDVTWTAPDDAYFDLALNDHEHLYFDPVLNNYEPTRSDFFSVEPWEKDRLKHLTPHYMKAFLTTVVNDDAFPTRGFPVLAAPTNGKGLYHNLLDILRNRTSSRPTFAALLDYHQLYPGHHSVHTYNLLISLSLHHRAYGSTYKLFHSMRKLSIRYNIETHRLYVRFFIFKGFWDKAWNYAMQLKDKFPDGSIPFPIWLEFCQARKPGPIIGATFNPKTKKSARVRDVHVTEDFISARNQLMSTNRPLSIPALKDTRPDGIRMVVQMMIRSGMKRQALKLTEDYFRALPPDMDNNMNHWCLEIVKIHLASNGIRKTLLPKFNAAKSLYFSLLSLNPSLRPTSNTLMFILFPLKGIKRCGTVAWKFISFCKEKWGPEVEDRQIRRRLVNLALKEGRMDIVETVLRAQRDQFRESSSYSTEREAVGEALPPLTEFADRPSIRRIYPGIGRENYLWFRLRLRVRRKMKKRAAQGRLFTMRKKQIPSSPSVNHKSPAHQS